MSIDLRQLRDKSEREEEELPPNKWIKTGDGDIPFIYRSLHLTELELKQQQGEQDARVLQEYHRQLKAIVPTVKTPFKTSRVKLEPEIQHMLAGWPNGVRIRDRAGLNFGEVGEICDDCSVFGYGTSIFTAIPLMYIVLGDFFETYLPKTPQLDFQCYALSLLNVDKHRAITDDSFMQSGNIRRWVKHVMERDIDVFFRPDMEDIVSNEADI